MDTERQKRFVNDGMDGMHFLTKKEQTMKTYKGNDGKRYTIPEPQNDVAELFAHIREQMSPDAVGVIAYQLHLASANNGEVEREVMWFKDELAEMVGGWDRVNEIAKQQGTYHFGDDAPGCKEE